MGIVEIFLVMFFICWFVFFYVIFLNNMLSENNDDLM